MAHAVSACVHCGFCLAACPTYRELGQEMDTPRGRIVLMKQVLEGSLSWDAAQPHIDRCLGCLACEPACPSGVPYRDLISPFRALAQEKFTRTPMEKLRRFLAAETLPYPARFVPFCFLNSSRTPDTTGQNMMKLLCTSSHPILSYLTLCCTISPALALLGFVDICDELLWRR